MLDLIRTYLRNRAFQKKCREHNRWREFRAELRLSRAYVHRHYESVCRRYPEVRLRASDLVAVLEHDKPVEIVEKSAGVPWKCDVSGKVFYHEKMALIAQMEAECAIMWLPNFEWAKKWNARRMRERSFLLLERYKVRAACHDRACFAYPDVCILAFNRIGFKRFAVLAIMTRADIVSPSV